MYYVYVRQWISCLFLDNFNSFDVKLTETSGNLFLLHLVLGIPNPTPSSARNPQIGPDHDPLRIGGSDLDPLGRMGGGGMMMDPRNMPGMRGGGSGRGIGPNFDPVFPGMPNPYGGPSAPMGPGFGPRGSGPSARGGRGGGRNFGDELPPPGYDDMFMWKDKETFFNEYKPKDMILQFLVIFLRICVWYTPNCNDSPLCHLNHVYSKLSLSWLLWLFSTNTIGVDAYTGRCSKNREGGATHLSAIIRDLTEFWQCYFTKINTPQ